MPADRFSRGEGTGVLPSSSSQQGLRAADPLLPAPELGDDNQRQQGADAERSLRYWRERLEGSSPMTALPPDRPRTAMQGAPASRLRVRVAARADVDALAALCRQEETSVFSGLLSAFTLLLARYAGQHDVLVGSRFDSHLSTVVLRVDLAGDPTFRELLARADEVVAGAAAHAEVPFETIVEALQPERDAGVNPFFQIMLEGLLLNDPFARPGATVTRLDGPAENARLDVHARFEDTPDGLVGSLTYNSDLYEEETISRFLANFAHVITVATAQPGVPISRLSVLAEPERRRVISEWNETATELSPSCIHTEVERQAARTPTRVALRSGERTLTYEELNRRADVLARRFRALGVGPDGLVGVCVPRGPELVVAVLAALKAGGAYLPLDPAYPTARLAQMIEGSRVGVIATTSQVSAQLPSGDARVVCLDAEAAPSESDAAAPPEGADPAASPENLAYVIYTSGSTGTPKGVMIEHRQVSSFFVGMDGVLGDRDPAKPGVWLAGTSLSFDISVLELLWTLARGFTVVLQPDDDKVGTFAAAVTAHGVTHFQCTPSMASLLVADEASRAALGALEAMLVGGEALSSGLARELLAAVRGDLLNMYGPTETTIWSTTWRVDREAFARDTTPALSIGRPIANTTLYVLDALREPVPIGVAGELYIGGAGLSRGYLGRPDLTDERFVPSPFGPGRLYRTGDLGRTRADGTIEFLGRVDHQVKIRGHRIELGEIELTLRELSGAREVVVMARQDEADRPGDQRLVAYLSGVTPSAAELRRLLRERLPEPMVPNAFVALETMPLTPNGKIDRKALPAPEAVAADHPAGGEGDERFAPPRTPTEHTIGAIWRELLRLPRVSVYDNFFDLGGHSLLSAQVVHRIEKRLKKRLHVAELVLQNLAQVSARCDQAADLEAPKASGVLGALKRLITKA